MPRPTIWPAALAVGLVAASFGMLTIGVFFYVGVALVAIAITGWMRDLIAAGAEPEPETRNPKPGTRNPEPETRNPKPAQPGGVH